jgi:hypothetical protein
VQGQDTVYDAAHNVMFHVSHAATFEALHDSLGFADSLSSLHDMDFSSLDPDLVGSLADGFHSL